MQDNFADGIGNINVFAGTVRVELLKIVRLDPVTSTPQFEPAHRLVMPLVSFMQTAERFAALRQKLLESGVVTEQAGASSTPATDAKARAKPAPKGSKGAAAKKA